MYIVPIYCARHFVGDDAFLHLVGDHIYENGLNGNGAQRLVEMACIEECAISAVQVSRENQLPFYGTVGGQQINGKPGLYRIDTVIEKPTPTQAEQRLIVPGLRSGQYLCFHGMHVLTASVFKILEEYFSSSSDGRAGFSATLAELALREQYLALIQQDRRFDVGMKYGMFKAQLALALSGDDRDEVLTELVSLLATRRITPVEGE